MAWSLLAAFFNAPWSWYAVVVVSRALVPFVWPLLNDGDVVGGSGCGGGGCGRSASGASSTLRRFEAGESTVCCKSSAAALLAMSCRMSIYDVPIMKFGDTRHVCAWGARRCELKLRKSRSARTQISSSSGQVQLSSRSQSRRHCDPISFPSLPPSSRYPSTHNGKSCRASN